MKGRFVGCPFVLFQHIHTVNRADYPYRAGNHVEGVAVRHLADVVNQQHGNLEAVSKGLDSPDFVVVIGIGVLIIHRPAYPLERVNHHKPRVWISRHEGFKLWYQGAGQVIRFRGKIALFRAVVGDVGEPEMEPVNGIFQCQVERPAFARFKLPYLPTSGHLLAEP